MAQKKHTPAQQEQVVSTVSSVELFFKNNEKLIEGVILGIIVVVCGFLALNKWYLIPAKEEAKAQMFTAEQQFRAGDYEKALNGDGNVLGFKDIIDQYGSKAGKSVYLYAGICCLRTGDNEAAVSYLKKYSTSDKIMAARALSCLGDAASNLGQTKEAVAYYKKAAAKDDSQYAAGYLLKAGIALEAAGDDAAALGFYKTIEQNYPNTMEGYDIQKYISRIENK
ncbi:MAG: tetratricopeptide repeat protein [Bacteroidales bacterium]|nr:tetratricopeptide repeat protein [Candidatus Equibacterium intestinale]